MHEISEARALRPPLVMSAEDHARLVALAEVITRRSPLVARLLMEEADRAEVMPAGQVPAGTVAVGSMVEFRDAATGEERRVQVPADHARGATLVRISTTAGFRPSAVDPGNRDSRYLGAWIRVGG